MIVPMLKYTFLVFHREYEKFLKEIRDLGVLHVLTKTDKATDVLQEKYKELSQIEKTIQFLEKRNQPEINTKPDLTTENIINEVLAKQIALDEYYVLIEDICKEIKAAEPWGNFSGDIIERLEKNGIYIRFFFTTKKKFLQLNEADLPLELISEQGNNSYFILIEKGTSKIKIDAEEIKAPAVPYHLLEAKKIDLENKVQDINNSLNKHASVSLPYLKKIKEELINKLEFDIVVANTSKQADEKLMVLEGWIPATRTTTIQNYLEKKEVLFFRSKPTPHDDIPVLLQNNWFSRLFEPIGSMFSLPDYSELDLTIFFAPFFMLFFGFCLGDAGYGLLFITGAGLYKLRANKPLKPYLTLIQFLGFATILFGSISGTFFGINLIESNINWLEEYKGLFLNPDKMFNLALILGGIQIIFGMFIKAANRIKQYGFSYALSTFGWLIILLGSIIYVLLTKSETIPREKTILYLILSSGGFFILFFSDPKRSIFSRIGKGVWDVYSTITGIFGDLLSYIRLFALGLSSAILGFVINDIGLQILGSSQILGPVFFVLFLILGHTLNILISSLGSFVHPMRLTFVEFYKSAGFTGGGKEYRPFRNSLKVEY